MKSHLLLAFCLLNAIATLAAERVAHEELSPHTIEGAAVKDGKVEVKLIRNVTWTREPSYPVTVTLKEGKGPAVLESTITSGESVELSGFVPPGKYTIYSAVDEASGYWGAFGGKITVSADGKLTVQPQFIEHMLKITLVAPAQMEVVEVARPTLKWKAVDGTKSYTVRWFEEDPVTRKVLTQKQGIKVSDSEWTFDVDVVPGRLYEWQVDANGEAGERIAYFASGYFRTK